VTVSLTPKLRSEVSEEAVPPLSAVEEAAVTAAVTAACDIAELGTPLNLAAHDLLRRLTRSRRIVLLATARVRADAAAQPDSAVLQRATQLLETVVAIGLFY
jgi:hypothetical protein